MLVSFSVTNFRSFGDEVTLNMVASNKIADHPNHLVPIGSTGRSLLRTAIIYGANAAGKTNLIRAMETAQRLIKDPRNKRISIDQFGFQRTSDDRKPTSFEFRFLVGSRVFVYGFDIRPDKIVSEWLSVIKNDDETTLFERDGDGKITVPESAAKQFPDDHLTFNALSVLKQLPVRNEQLFLNHALSLPESVQGETLRSILKWFTTDLIVLPANSRSSELLERLHGDVNFRFFCSNFLNNVGTGVRNLGIVQKERERSEWERRLFSDSPNRFGYSQGDTDIITVPEKPGVVIERKLFSEHHIAPHTFALPFSEESDGTQALLHLMPALASPPEESHVIVLDELDRSLHPLICWEFIRFFSESCEGSPRQLIVTTHEAHLLNQELLRRDEYWFAEKDARQQTQLSSLIDFNIRKDLKIEKGYLQGRFGAIPFIGGMNNLEEILNCDTLEETDAAQDPSSEP